MQAVVHHKYVAVHFIHSAKMVVGRGTTNFTKCVKGVSMGQDQTCTVTQFGLSPQEASHLLPFLAWLYILHCYH